jgi:putative SOS response-associated peptidase YedK
MCGRFTLTTPAQTLAVQFDLAQVPALEPRYNIAPTQPVAAVRVGSESKERELVLMRWGLIPFWAKDSTIGGRMINARSETVAEKPSFRTAFRRRRCLVLADGFYEWQKVDGAKQPIYVSLQDRGAFAFAGLWERWEGSENGVVESCTLLTCEPNELLRPVHNRMPVILNPKDYTLWLDREVQEAGSLKTLLGPYPPGRMQAYAVSRYVNSPRNEGPECIVRIGEPGEPQLPGF